MKNNYKNELIFPDEMVIDNKWERFLEIQVIHSSSKYILLGIITILFLFIFLNEWWLRAINNPLICLLHHKCEITVLRSSIE